MTRDSQLLLAETMGMIAHELGKPHIPLLDKGLQAMFTPEPSYENTNLLRAWHRGWIKARLALVEELTP